METRIPNSYPFKEEILKSLKLKKEQVCNANRSPSLVFPPILLFKKKKKTLITYHRGLKRRWNSRRMHDGWSKTGSGIYLATAICTRMLLSLWRKIWYVCCFHRPTPDPTLLCSCVILILYKAFTKKEDMTTTINNIYTREAKGYI